MSSEWRQIKVSDFGRIVTGKTPSTARSDFFGGLIPFLTPTDMPDGQKYVNAERTLTDAGLATIKSCLIPKGVAVSCIGWKMGKSVLVTEPTVTNQQINTVVVDESRFDLSFVYYLLTSMRAQIFELGATPTRTPIVNKSTFGNMTVVVPGLSEQRGISNLCTAFDDRIALLRETNATLEAVAQALFKSWFVDFDPVRARMEGRAPEGMDEATAALFPDGFEESELGLVPKAWKATNLARLIKDYDGSIQTGPFGSQLHASDYLEAGTPVVMPKDIKNRRATTDSVARIGAADVERLSRHKVLAGDIVFSRRGDVEKHALITKREVGWICGTGCLLLRPGKSWPSSTFLSMTLDAPKARTWLVQHAVGATMPNINTGILGSVPLILPPDALLKEFENVISVSEELRSQNSSTSETLATLRDTLLPRLISGQLRLPEAQAAAEEALA